MFGRLFVRGVIKMNDIIEKLGIESKYRVSIVNGDIILDLEQQRNDLLERDIIFMGHLKRILSEIREYKYDNPINVIQKVMKCFDFTLDKKATGKSWEEIKELLS